MNINDIDKQIERLESLKSAVQKEFNNQLIEILIKQLTDTKILVKVMQDQLKFNDSQMKINKIMSEDLKEALELMKSNANILESHNKQITELFETTIRSKRI